MKTLNTILSICSKYTLNGSFETKGKTTLSEIFAPNPIPVDLHNYGVYIIVEVKEGEDCEEVVYIGKSGTMKQ
ncbi:MAG: hypothetical protein ACRC3G_02040, partial [Bacteroidales bacterium]